jgi:hypothetical protein
MLINKYGIYIIIIDSHISQPSQQQKLHVPKSTPRNTYTNEFKSIPQPINQHNHSSIGSGKHLRNHGQGQFTNSPAF